MGQRELLGLTASELELMLGDALVADEFGAKDLSAAERRAAARRWFNAHLQDFREAICVSSPLRTMIFSADKVDRNTLFAAVIDAVGTTVLGTHVPIAVLSARLIQYGLDTLCAGYSEQAG